MKLNFRQQGPQATPITRLGRSRPSRRMRALLKAALAASLSLSLACGAAAAGQVEGVAFDKQATAGPHLLHLRGFGLLRYMVFLKAYVAALYLPETVASAEALGDVPKCLEIEYFHAISAPDFADATTTSIERNVSPTAFRRLKPKIEEFNSLYRDIAPGDRYALSYDPGRGTTLLFNGKALGTVPSDDVAEALFAIWLGSSPLDDNLKERLLGG